MPHPEGVPDLGPGPPPDRRRTTAALPWSDEAACRGADPALFFRDDDAAALAYCARCPVVDPCLRSTLAVESAVGYRYGVFGGTNPRQRARIGRVLGGAKLRTWA